MTPRIIFQNNQNHRKNYVEKYLSKNHLFYNFKNLYHEDIFFIIQLHLYFTTRDKVNYRLIINSIIIFATITITIAIIIKTIRNHLKNNQHHKKYLNFLYLRS